MPIKSASDKPMAACKEQDQLIEASHKAVRAYSDAVNSLSDLARMSSVEFEHMREIAERARAISREARDRLRTHMAQHGC